MTGKMQLWENSLKIILHGFTFLPISIIEEYVTEFNKLLNNWLINDSIFYI